ncbi:hypothetical protein TNCV_2619731 [Trichonephila clavipes]|uniref:Uncharacterized protein n=1 Tax=Trichonephila clavipes TaxID=2585209 RepID=A0A8X6WKZ5_TRICX|nr:hypothetical protein TNCV_2619731 [Trichonephila clavipes]
MSVPSQLWQNEFLECVQSSKSIIDSDFDDGNETNSAVSVPKSSKMRKVMKSMGNYLDARSNDKMYNKLHDIEQFDTKSNGKKNIRLFSKNSIHVRFSENLKTEPSFEFW